MNEEQPSWGKSLLAGIGFAVCWVGVAVVLVWAAVIGYGILVGE